MEREIKFRAWDKKFQEMVEISELRWSERQNTFYACNLNGSVGVWYTPFDDQCMLMQYTGLKDKNGVEIYEGDILKFTHDTSMLNWAVEANVFGGYSIYNLNGHPSAIRYPVDSPSFFIDREVIGNIYQNPELLNIKT